MQTPQLWGDMRSRMSREAHVWICEGLGGEVPPGYSTGGRGGETPGYPIICRKSYWSITSQHSRKCSSPGKLAFFRPPLSATLSATYWVEWYSQ